MLGFLLLQGRRRRRRQPGVDSSTPTPTATAEEGDADADATPDEDRDARADADRDRDARADAGAGRASKPKGSASQLQLQAYNLNNAGKYDEALPVAAGGGQEGLQGQRAGSARAATRSTSSPAPSSAPATRRARSTRSSSASQRYPDDQRSTVEKLLDRAKQQAGRATAADCAAVRFDAVARAVAGVPFMSPEQGRLVYDHVRETQPDAVLELGTAHGVGAAYLAGALADNAPRRT